MNLKEAPLFEGLSMSELKRVEDCLREVSFGRNEILFNEGAGCERVYIVRSGRVKLYRMAASGREQTLETLGPGDTCACNPGAALWHCSATAQAVAPATVWVMSRFDYIQMVQSSTQLAHALNKLFAHKLQCMIALVEEISLKDVKKRLVKFLLDMLKEKAGSSAKSKVLFIPFTREEIAQRLGAARETVARHLSALKRKKLIDLKPHQIIILDQSGLEKLLS